MIHKRRRSAVKPPCLPDVAVKQVEQLVTDILGYSSAYADDAPFMAYLKEHLMSKYLDERLVPASDRRDAAINKWLQTEARNADYNAKSQRLGSSTLPLTSDVYSLSKPAIVQLAREFIQSAIGDEPPADMIPTYGSFSGGASTGFRRHASNLSRKYGRAVDITKLLTAWLNANGGVEFNLGISEEELNFVPGNILFTVPKKTAIDRVACKEPDWNCYCQKAAGMLIRKSLRPFGIDLNDQSRNRELAREGSLTGGYATIDLSSASDTLTLETVKSLVPPAWFRFFYAASCRVTQISGRPDHRNAMLSSMGNGFTFELESLIFYSLIRAVRRLTYVQGRLLVYGDDIIVPTPMAPATLEVLGAFGFIPNDNKTFLTGPIRESCGGHYYKGADITPFYIRKKPESIVDLITILNGLRKWMILTGIHYMDPIWEEWWRKLAEYVPECVKGGFDFGDSSILVSYGRPPIARVLNKTSECKVHTKGALIQWLTQSQARPTGRIQVDYALPPGLHEKVREEVIRSILDGEKTSVLRVLETHPKEFVYQKIRKDQWYAFRDYTQPLLYEGFV